MKKIKTVDAVGHVLCHDITQIIKDVKCGAVFKKGHVVKEEDIPVLLSVGKENLYIYEANDQFLHENDAALILHDVCINEFMEAKPVTEGKIELIAAADGLLKVDVEKLSQLNGLGNLIIATRHNNTVVKKGDKLAGTRVIPLMIEKEKMDEVKAIGKGRSVLEIKPFHSFKVAVITTGNEVYRGRITDTFTPVIEEKLARFNLKKDIHKVVPDDIELIKTAILDAISEGAQLVVCTGGMSVDPDDLTPGAIKATGADILTYGAPVLPGSMLLVADLDGVPILGLPGCVMYADATSFDLVLPRILAKDRITKKEIASLGHGGLCLKCAVCTYPHCEFGKGW